MALATAAKGTAAFGTVATVAILADEDRRDAIWDVAYGTVRAGRAISYAAVVAADYKVNLRKKERGSEPYEEAKSKIHQRAANRLLHVCSRHGGVYTKFGQHIASMNHIMPKQYTDTLKVLQDKNPSVSRETVGRTVRSELGGSIEELFAEFDDQPIAAASLAQVHRAVTKMGKEVAVKVQYPGLEMQVQKDVLTMRLLAQALGWLFPEYEYTWMFPEFEESIKLELDFVQEGTNAERVARMFAGKADVHVPPIHWEYTTRRVLVMDFIHGIKITDVARIAAEGMDTTQVARTVASAFGDMIYYHGFVHCDPHPGNLMVRRMPGHEQEQVKPAKRHWWNPWHWVRPPGPKAVPHQVVLLDHGMYRRLDPGFRHTYCRLWKAFMTRDDKLGRESAVQLGLTPDLYEALSLLLTWRPPSTKARVGARITEDERQQLAQKYKHIITPEMINSFLEAMPRDMLFVMRTGDLVRGLNKDLGGTSRQRLVILGESAIKGLALPNVTQAARIGPPDNKEAAFRKHLEAVGIWGPATLALSHPDAPINQLVSSEAGSQQSTLSMYDLYGLRLRMWILDAALGLQWWWSGHTSFTTRDIG